MFSENGMYMNICMLGYWKNNIKCYVLVLNNNEQSDKMKQMY